MEEWGKGHGIVHLMKEWAKENGILDLMGRVGNGPGTVDLLGEWESVLGTADSQVFCIFPLTIIFQKLSTQISFLLL